MSVAEQVQRGVEWLDEREPGWVGMIDLVAFDMRQPCRCVLGQVFAPPPALGASGYRVIYDELLDSGRMTRTWMVEHGFVSEAAVEEFGGQWTALQDEWLRVLRAARSAGHAMTPHVVCHAEGCTTPVPPRVFVCKPHWRRLPKVMRDAVWGAYRPGQEYRKDPSVEYLDAAAAAVMWLAAKEAKATK